MEQVAEKLSLIEAKIQKLSIQLKQLETKNAALEKENKTLKIELSEKNVKFSAVEQGLTDAQAQMIHQKEHDPESTYKFRKEIDRYIEEIDKCIEWLHNY